MLILWSIIIICYITSCVEAITVECLPNLENSTCIVQKLEVTKKGQFIKNILNGDLKSNELFIHDKKVNYIPLNLGDKFPSLTSLKIQRSKLMEITRDEFRGIQKLNRLNLWNNQLKNLKTDVFYDLVELEELDLSSNDLTKLEKKTFKKLSNLRALNLDSNNLLEIDVNLFRNTQKLEKLSIKDNYLKKIPTMILGNLPNLGTLEIDNNELIGLQDNIFEGTKSLKRFTVSNNLISFIGAKIINQINVLSSNDFRYNDCTESLSQDYGSEELIEVIKTKCEPDQITKIEWLQDEIGYVKRLKRESEIELNCAEQEIKSNSENINSTRSFLADLINNPENQKSKVDSFVERLKIELPLELNKIYMPMQAKIDRTAEIASNLKTNLDKIPKDTEANIKTELNQVSKMLKTDLTQVLNTELGSMKNEVKCDSNEISTLVKDSFKNFPSDVKNLIEKDLSEKIKTTIESAMQNQKTDINHLKTTLTKFVTDHTNLQPDLAQIKLQVEKIGKCDFFKDCFEFLKKTVDYIENGKMNQFLAILSSIKEKMSKNQLSITIDFPDIFKNEQKTEAENEIRTFEENFKTNCQLTTDPNTERT